MIETEDRFKDHTDRELIRPPWDGRFPYNSREEILESGLSEWIKFQFRAAWYGGKDVKARLPIDRLGTRLIVGIRDRAFAFYIDEQGDDLRTFMLLVEPFTWKCPDDKVTEKVTAGVEQEVCSFVDGLFWAVLKTFPQIADTDLSTEIRVKLSEALVRLDDLEVERLDGLESQAERNHKVAVASSSEAD